MFLGWMKQIVASVLCPTDTKVLVEPTGDLWGGKAVGGDLSQRRARLCSQRTGGQPAITPSHWDRHTSVGS